MSEKYSDVRAVLRAINRTQKFFYGAKVTVDSNGKATLETEWRNPELAGIWLFRKGIQQKCLIKLCTKGILLRDRTVGLQIETYQFSQTAFERQK